MRACKTREGVQRSGMSPWFCAVDPSRPLLSSCIGLGGAVIDGMQGIHPEGARDNNPLALLASAFEQTESEWIFFTGAEGLCLNAEHIERLLENRFDVSIVVARCKNAGSSPYGLYHRDCLPFIKDLLRKGRTRLAALTSVLPTREIDLDSTEVEEGCPDTSEAISAVSHRCQPDTPIFSHDEGGGKEHGESGEGHGKGHVDKAARRRPLVITDPADERMRMPVEQSVGILLNDLHVVTVQCSPYGREELAVGLLLSEGFIRDRDAFRSVEVDRRRKLVYVTTDEPLPGRLKGEKGIITSGCGQGVTFLSLDQLDTLDEIESSLRVDPNDLLTMMRNLSTDSPRRNDTGGVHSCALGKDGKLLIIREDIGRHNAIDKLTGHAWLNRMDTSDLILVSTGRISYEMAFKAARARIPIIISRHGITDLAAHVASRLNITAVSYCRGNSMTVLTHPWRIAG